MILVPGAGPAMELWHGVRPLALQRRTQDVGEEVMVSVPRAFVVERDDEQVRAFESLQHGLPRTGRDAGHGVAKGTAQSVEDRRVQQEGARVLRLRAEHFVRQVVQDESVAARERPDEGVEVVPTLHRQRRQLETRDPALGTRVECGHAILREVDSHRVFEEPGRFVHREAEVLRAQLRQPTTRTQPGQRQGWIFTRDDHDVNVRRKVLDENAEHRVDGRTVDRVVIVEHEDEAAGVGEVVDERGHERLRRCQARCIEGRQDALADARFHRA